MSTLPYPDFGSLGLPTWGTTTTSTTGGTSGFLTSLGGSLLTGGAGFLSPIGGQLLGSLGVSDGVSDVLDNGFNLSCWGSSYSPKEAETDAPLRLDYCKAKSGINTEITEQTLFNYMRFTKSLMRAFNLLANDSSLADCTREGHKFQYDYFKQANQSLYTQLINMGYTWEYGKLVPVSTDFNDMIPNWGSSLIINTEIKSIYNFKTPNQVGNLTAVAEIDNLSNSESTNTNSLTNNNQSEQSSFPWWLVIPFII